MAAAHGRQGSAAHRNAVCRQHAKKRLDWHIDAKLPRPTGGSAPTPGLAARAPNLRYDPASGKWFPVFGPDNVVARACIFHGTISRFCEECRREREEVRQQVEALRQEVRENWPELHGFPPTEEKTIKVENIDRHVYATPLNCPETITSIKSCCHVTRYT